MAALLGVNIDRTISLTFVIGAALAAVAGIMYLLYYGVIDFYIGFVAGVKAFTAAVLGGIGSLPGAMLGGLLIGLIETFWSAYFSIEYKDVAAFSILDRRADLPADRHPRPAGGREGVRRCPTPRPQPATLPLLAALKDAALAGAGRVRPVLLHDRAAHRAGPDRRARDHHALRDAGDPGRPRCSPARSCAR